MNLVDELAILATTLSPDWLAILQFWTWGAGVVGGGLGGAGVVGGGGLRFAIVHV